jgi:hypothetical protein
VNPKLTSWLQAAAGTVLSGLVVFGVIGPDKLDTIQALIASILPLITGLLVHSVRRS